MKVILLKDEKKYGKKGDIIEVSDGFAKNYLIPNKIATYATSTALNQAKQLKESEQHKQEVMLMQAKELKDKIEKTQIKLSVKVGENGKVFGSVTSKEISQEFEKQGIIFDKKKIKLDNPIKSIGLFTIKAKLHPQVTANIKLEVVASN